VIDATDKDGWTALHRAVWNEHEAVVHLLVEKGAAVDETVARFLEAHNIAQ
jgi:ankyrin repeat protein